MVLLVVSEEVIGENVEASHWNCPLHHSSSNRYHHYHVHGEGGRHYHGSSADHPKRVRWVV